MFEATTVTILTTEQLPMFEATTVTFLTTEQLPMVKATTVAVLNMEQKFRFMAFSERPVRVTITGTTRTFGHRPENRQPKREKWVARLLGLAVWVPLLLVGAGAFLACRSCSWPGRVSGCPVVVVCLFFGGLLLGAPVCVVLGRQPKNWPFLWTCGSVAPRVFWLRPSLVRRSMGRFNCCAWSKPQVVKATGGQSYRWSKPQVVKATGGQSHSRSKRRVVKATGGQSHR